MFNFVFLQLLNLGEDLSINLNPPVASATICSVLFNKFCLNRYTLDIPVKSSCVRVNKTFDI